METHCKYLTSKKRHFLCKNCDFECFKQSEWERHINTIKHGYRNKGNAQEISVNAGVFYAPNCTKFIFQNRFLLKNKLI